MNRKLLPYERGLCTQLGLSEDDYLLFLAAQKDYRLSQEEREEELRGEPTSIILFVVGVLFQVAAALLAPKPEQPKRAYQGQRRDKTYAPRYGFNGTQELARYGDPINLVYCNQAINPNGAVRAATSLLWSSVESTGSGQYMQLLLLVGAAGIKRLDYEKTAFGQLRASQFAASNTWIYYAEQNGPVPFAGKVLGDARDPAAEHGGALTHMVTTLQGNPRQGYSQAYTPTTMKDVGVYAPIPINVDIFERDSKGKIRDHNIGIHINGGAYQPKYEVGDALTFHFDKVDRDQSSEDWAVANEAAKDLRLQLVNNLDRGAIYIMGSAAFKVRRIDDDTSMNKDRLTVYLECTEAGYPPTTEYRRTKAKQYTQADKDAYTKAKDVLSAPVKDDVLQLTVNDVLSTGMIEVERASRHKYWLGVTPAQQQNRAQQSTIFRDDVWIQKFGGGGGSENNKTYQFVGTETITWINDLDKASSAVVPVGGSIAYTEEVLERFLADKPKISTKLLRAEYQDDKKKLRRIRDKISAGQYRTQIRAYIRATHPTAIDLVNRINGLNEALALATGDDLEAAWRVEARAQPYAQNCKAEISRLRAKIDDLSDGELGGKAVKRVKNWENQIEALRDARRDYLNDYVAAKRKESKGAGASKEQIKIWRAELEGRRNELQEYISNQLDATRDDLMRMTREERSPFTLSGISTERFACGLECLDDKLDQLRGEWTTDQAGTTAVRGRLRAIIAEKQKALQWLRYLLKNWESLIRDTDDSFYVKCIAKKAKAAYQTVTTCNQVRFNFRCRLFRRISGRQMDYGEEEAPDGYKLSDNGINRRTMFFYMLMRRASSDPWIRVQRVFAVERGSDSDHYITLLFRSETAAKREFRFVPVLDPAAEMKENSYESYAYIQNAGAVREIVTSDGVIQYFGRVVDVDTNRFPALKERGPMYTNEWDMFSAHSDTQVQASFDSGPEASLVNVTEQTYCNLDAQKYKDMSLMAFHTYASQGIDDLRSITAYVLEGKASWKINDTTNQPYQSGSGACYAPDIFTDTVLDGTNGIKSFANANAIDWQQLAAAKRFCKNNGLGCQMFMDGVVADRRSWREFWVEVGPYSLLEFARLNGKETLIPAVPVDVNGVATSQITVSALFNEGNIIEDSYREEYLDYGDNTKDLVVTVVYREVLEDESFPRNTSVTLCRADTDTSDAVWQTFDLSDWVSQRRQAELYGRYLCQQRRYIGRTIEFRTVPTDSPITPGSYIYVDIGLRRWDTVRTGVVRDNGALDLPLDVAIPDGTYTVMTYQSGGSPQTHDGVAIAQGVATGLSADAGSLFVLGTSNDARRVFRVVEVSMDEEGEITVRGVEHPCTINGATITSHAADLSDGLFREVGVGC